MMECRWKGVDGEIKARLKVSTANHLWEVSDMRTGNVPHQWTRMIRGSEVCGSVKKCQCQDAQQVGSKEP
ncbi:hypothetical protein AMATHDRAFT_58501 [Amanita thiersii Skay4041]|uniref:Uncharacterized protein n=1 Tax=Amanita thiersii Skay4041 TaxID=703135 RepID=A0A2A9NVJ8_9AGAR|nr:hypothetical protein AMATHDRAFT_58501 [Amanita thiersii Skay4041]